MRELFLLRGLPGSGKSTWIKTNGLEQLFTLSADTIRKLCHSYTLRADGMFEINNSCNKKVFEFFYEMLKMRMEKGETVFIDNTNINPNSVHRIKNMVKEYDYRMTVVDFTDIPLDEVKRRNRCRSSELVVPDAVIDRMYNMLQNTKSQLNFDRVCKPNEVRKYLIYPQDFSKYNKIHHIGDIHGCYTVLQEALNNGQLNPDELYIFLGDYLDRGIENSKTLRFLIDINEKENVILLKGNHEIHLKNWSKDKTVCSKQFNEYTKAEIEKDFTKKEVLSFYRSLKPYVYYTYGNKEILCCHGGISAIPNNLLFVTENELINGCGDYDDHQTCEESFDRLTAKYTYQIHGHRNTKHLPIHATKRCFNLEGGVERGGFLRCVTLSKDGFDCSEFKNNIYAEKESIQNHKKG